MKLYIHIIHSISTLLFLCAVAYVCAWEGHRSNLGVPQVPSTLFLEKTLAFAWSWPSRLVCLVCEPEGHLGCREDGSNPVSFLLWYNTFTSNHREEGLVCLHFQDVAHPNREVTDAGLLGTPHLQSKAKRRKVPVLPAYSHWASSCLTQFEIPHLGNAVSPSGLGLSTSINSQDNPS